MSGFDVLFKSQQQMQQTRLGYDKMRYSMEQQLGETLGQLPQNYLAGAKAASDLRIQEQQAEISAMQSKMQLSNMYEQSKQLKTQTQLGNLQLQQAQYDFDQRSETKQSKLMQQRREYVQKSASAMIKVGKVPTADGTGFRDMTPEERRFYQEGESDQYKLRMSPSELRLQIDQIGRNYRNMFGSGVNMTRLQANATDYARYLQLKKRLDEVMGFTVPGFGGTETAGDAQTGAAGAGAATSEPAAEPAAEPVAPAEVNAGPLSAPGGYSTESFLAGESPEVQQQFYGIAALASEDDRVLEILRGVGSDQGRDRLIMSLAKAADAMSSGPNAVATPGQASKRVMDSFFKDGNPDFHAYVLVSAGTPEEGGYTDDQIRAWLRSRPRIASLIQFGREDQANRYIEGAIRRARNAQAQAQANTPQAQLDAANQELMAEREAQYDRIMAERAQGTRPDPGKPTQGPASPLDPLMTQKAGEAIASTPVGGRYLGPDDTAPTSTPPDLRIEDIDEDAIRLSKPYLQSVPQKNQDTPFARPVKPPQTLSSGGAAEVPAVEPEGVAPDMPFKVDEEIGEAKPTDIAKRNESRRLLESMGKKMFKRLSPVVERLYKASDTTIDQLTGDRALTESLGETGTRAFRARQQQLSNRLDEAVNQVLAQLKQNIDKASEAFDGPLPPSVYSELAKKAEAKIKKLEQEYMRAAGRRKK